MLRADIQKTEAEAARLGEEIADLDETIATIEGDTKAAMKVRDMEHADFLAAQADYQGSVDALGKGIETMKAQSADVAGLTQVSQKLFASPHVDDKAKQALRAYLEQDKEDVDAEALTKKGGVSMLQGGEAGPSADAYNFQSQ